MFPDGQLAFVAIGVLLSLAHFLSHAVSKRLEKIHFRLLSFSSGVFVTFLFLESIPRVSALGYGPALALLGFACYHVLEKFVYQHRHPNELRRQIGRVHAAGYFLGGFLEGLLVMLVFKVGSQSTLILIPLFIHALASTFSLSRISERKKDSLAYRALLSSAPLLGVLAATQFGAASLASKAVFSFIIGAILYVSFRDAIPRGKAGSPAHFVLGAILMFLLLSL